MNLFLRFISIYILLFQSCDFAPGSYPYAERYEVNFSEDSVKNAIAEFKQDHPEFIVPEVTVDNEFFWELEDGTAQDPSLWNSFYFYYKESNQIIFTLTRPIHTQKTAIFFVSINEGLKVGDWKRINKDFSREENKKQKDKFENEILNKIKEHLKSKSVVP